MLQEFMLVWLCIYFNYYAITLLLPTTLHRAFAHVNSVAGLEYLYLMALSVLELIFNYLSPYIMNHPSIGRKSGIFWTLILIIIFSILSIILGSNNLIGTFVCLSVIKASVTVAFAIVYIYTAELYETLLRSKAEGFCALLGRTSTAFLGIVGLPATKWLNGQGLFLLFAVMSVFGSITIFRMPFDTLKARKN